jgi:hypothetical protein
MHVYCSLEDEYGNQSHGSYNDIVVLQDKGGTMIGPDILLLNLQKDIVDLGCLPNDLAKRH